MSITLSLFLVQVMNMVPEADTELAAIIRNQQIKQAVMDYSRDRPEMITVDVTGDGGRYYNITNLTQWSDQFSSIHSIQYPAPDVSADEVPQYLDPADWDDEYYDGSTHYIFFPNHSPASTESFRVLYSAPYLWAAGSTTTAVTQSGHGFSVNDFVYQGSDGTWVAAGSDANLLATHKVTAVADSSNFTATELAVSIPPADFFAVCNRTACLICYAIAEKYSRTSDSTITADSANHPSRAPEFEARAEKFCALYAAHLGISDGGQGDEANQPLAEFVDLDPMPGWPTGRDFIFHGRGNR